MASLPEVKQYLAHWFQLGRKVYIHNGDLGLLPSRVFQEMEYSAEFERCWESIVADDAGDCYLEDTTQTIVELLTSKWDVVDCARCNMPVPLLVVSAVPSDGCPCINISHWPNAEIPAPIARTVVGSKIQALQQRLSGADSLNNDRQK
jgi:hypothetical protein